MPRRKKNVHTNPSKAGVQNMPMNYVKDNQDTESTMSGILPIYKKGFEYRENYKGLWEEETLLKAITEYFEYCEANSVKVAKVGLALWLGMSKSQIYEWAGNPNKYQFKSDLINQAFDAIELSYIGRVEKYPTGNIFLLRTSHGHVESSKVEITKVGELTTADVNDAINKLGLDKPKE